MNDMHHFAEIVARKRKEKKLTQEALAKQLGDQRCAVLREGQKHMLLIHILMAVFHRDLLGALHGLNGLLGELVHIHK